MSGKKCGFVGKYSESKNHFHIQHVNFSNSVASMINSNLYKSFLKLSNNYYVMYSHHNQILIDKYLMDSHDWLIYKLKLHENNKGLTVSVKIEDFGKGSKHAKYLFEFGVTDQLNHQKMCKSAYCYQHENDFESVTFSFDDLNKLKRSDFNIEYYLTFKNCSGSDLAGKQSTKKNFFLTKK